MDVLLLRQSSEQAGGGENDVAKCSVVDDGPADDRGAIEISATDPTRMDLPHCQSDATAVVFGNAWQGLKDSDPVMLYPTINASGPVHTTASHASRTNPHLLEQLD